MIIHYLHDGRKLYSPRGTDYGIMARKIPTMYRLFSIFAAIAGLAVQAAGSPPAVADSRRPCIVATIFPVYDWVRQIVGNRAAKVDLMLLQDGTADFHSYRPTVRDLERIARCDLFIHVGGDSDAWTGGALAQGGNQRRHVLNLIKALGVHAKQEKTTPGMQTDTSDVIAGTDEHVWLSVRNAARLTDPIAVALCGIDPAGMEEYLLQAQSYRKKLDELDAKYSSRIARCPFRTLVFGDRFPFRYLADDYSLTCHAAFPGCSAESEASFKTIAFLARKVDELDLPAILTLERSGNRIAETIRNATKTKRQKVLRMDSLQSVSRTAAGRTTYLDAMRRNLAVLAEALGEGTEQCK